MLKASGMVRIVSTPAASSPSNTRRTMFTFSLLLNTDPCATRRRMSFPEDGLAIMPTHATRSPPAIISHCRFEMPLSSSYDVCQTLLPLYDARVCLLMTDVMIWPPTHKTYTLNTFLLDT